MSTSSSALAVTFTFESEESDFANTLHLNGAFIAPELREYAGNPITYVVGVEDADSFYAELVGNTDQAVKYGIDLDQNGWLDESDVVLFTGSPDQFTIRDLQYAALENHTANFLLQFEDIATDGDADFNDFVARVDLAAFPGVQGSRYRGGHDDYCSSDYAFS
jgi:hypothetical protein